MQQTHTPPSRRSRTTALRVFLFILFLLPYKTTSLCQKCRCYTVRCSSEEDGCIPQYNSLCDTKNDVVPEDSCAVDCDCCLRGNCYKASQYTCAMYRLFDFFTSIFIVMLVGNYFMIKVLDRKMFWREIEHRFEEEIWEGEVAKAEKDRDNTRKRWKEERKTLLKKSSNIVVVRYSGNYEMTISEEELAHIDEAPSKSLIKGIFDEIYIYRNLAAMNKQVILVLRGCYFVLSVITVSDVVFMWALPFIYVYSVWLEVILQLFIIFLVVFSSFKMEKYYEKVRSALKRYEQKKHLMISVRPKEKKIEVLFLKSEDHKRIFL